MLQPWTIVPREVKPASKVTACIKAPIEVRPFAAFADQPMARPQG
jgi:hypothetical protein